MGIKERTNAFFLSVFALAFSLMPTSAIAGGFGFGFGQFRLKDHVQNVIDWITGPLGFTLATLLMIYFIMMIAIKSRRNESWGGFLVGFVAIFAFLNVDDFMDQFFSASGALM
jgi:type IV secretory pathway VirB2 component (pilin)